MPRKSSIQTLPTDLLDRLNKQIADGTRTLDQLTEWLDEAGHARSRSAIHRHASKIEKVQEKLRQSREITEAVTKELGDAAAQGKQGRLLVEMARGVVFDLLMEIQDEDGGAVNTKDVALLGKGLAEMARALRLDQDFETKIREEERKRLEREVAQRLDQAIEGETGLTAAAAASLRERVLGVRTASGGHGS